MTKGIFSNIVVAVSLAVIAANLTYMNFRKPVAEPAMVEQKVVKVVGRVTTVFDGLGASTGFLVKDGDRLTIVPYDRGSMADTGFRPAYINVVKFTDGHVALDNLVVEEF